MPGLHASVDDFAGLAKRLKDAGETGLQRRLYKAIGDAATPLAAEVRDPVHLRPYMPDRYAEILASDLDVTTLKRAGNNPSIQIRVAGRSKDRQVIKLELGFLRHPVFPRGRARRDWAWRTQTGGMREGFFASAVRDTGTKVRDDIAQAIQDTRDQITRG
jgi:hypothetical protein